MQSCRWQQSSSIWTGQRSTSRQREEAPKDAEGTHREWCAGTGCLWSPAGVYGPGSPSETAGWGSDANQCSTPYLVERKEKSGSVQQLNHVGGRLSTRRSFTKRPLWWFAFETIKRTCWNLILITSYNNSTDGQQHVLRALNQKGSLSRQ